MLIFRIKLLGVTDVAKRDVVFINYEKIVFLIKKIYRNNTIFCEELNKKMGTTRTTKWVSEWKRNSNLPSPQEAAIICILLKTTPEEILTEQADIDLVKGLLENDPGIKEAPATEGEGSDGKIAQFIRSASAEELAEISRYIDFLESKRAKK